jgi:hypothetical protein
MQYFYKDFASFFATVTVFWLLPAARSRSSSCSCSWGHADLISISAAQVVLNVVNVSSEIGFLQLLIGTCLLHLASCAALRGVLEGVEEKEEALWRDPVADLELLLLQQRCCRRPWACPELPPT